MTTIRFGTEFSRSVATALVAIVNTAHTLSTNHVADMLLRTGANEFWRVSLEAKRHDQAAFENLSIGMDKIETRTDSLALRLVLKLYSLHAITCSATKRIAG